MSTAVFKVFRTGADCDQVQVADAPSGDTYVTEGSTTTGDFHLARVTPAGTFAWNKKLSIPDASTYTIVRIASNSTHVVVAAVYDNDSSAYTETLVAKYLANGTLVWSVTLRLMFSGEIADSLAISSDGSVYIAALDSDSLETPLVKLNASTGAVTWAVNLRETGFTTGTNYADTIVTLSGGDPVIYAFGPVHTGADGQAYVQRLSQTDGSVSWSRGVDWPGTLNRTSIGVDSSDNLYLVGPQHVPGSYNELSLIKLASDGSTTWNRKLQRPSGFSSGSIQWHMEGARRLVADTSGVFIPGYNSGPTGVKNAHTFVAAAGTIGANLATVSTYDTVGGAAVGAASAGGAAAEVLVGFIDSSTYTYNYIVRSASTGAANDGSYGPYTRTSYTYDVASGTATIASATYTRASAPTVTSTSVSLTTASGTLEAAAYAGTSSFAVAPLGPTASVGHAALFGVPASIAPVTVFGTPALGGETPTAYVASAPISTTFGTAALNLNTVSSVVGIEPTTVFGIPDGIRGSAPEPVGQVRAFVPSTAFGKPSVLATQVGQATGFCSTVLPTAVVTAQQPVASLGPTARFGTPALTISSTPSWTVSTTFGRATAVQVATPAGFSSTHFGRPQASSLLICTATGFSSTVVGAPVHGLRLTPRSVLFRTKFGQAQVERFAP